MSEFKLVEQQTLCKEIRMYDEPLEIIRSYKYLGVVFDEHLNFNDCVETLSKSAERALGGMINKYKHMGYMNYDTFTYLYNAYVIDYHNSMWGYKLRKSSESVQNRAIRFYSGLGKNSTICGYQYDMKWLLLHNRWKVNKLNLCRWIRIDTHTKCS